MAASKPLWFAARDEHGEPSCTALLRTGDQMHVVTLRHDRATGTVCMDASAEVHVRLQGRTAQVQQRLQQSASLEEFLDDLQDMLTVAEPTATDPRRDLPSVHYYTTVMQQLGALGWQHVAEVDDDLRHLTLTHTDDGGRVHKLHVSLPSSYPTAAPTVKAELPVPFAVVWPPPGADATLKVLHEQFVTAVGQLRELWEALDDMDAHCWVLDAAGTSLAEPTRRLGLGNHCSLQITLDPKAPRAFPALRFMGSDTALAPLKAALNRNMPRWDSSQLPRGNLERLLDISLPSKRAAEVAGNAGQFTVECAICYAYELNGEPPSKACDNPKCAQPFHTVCLGEWLRAVPTTRQSFQTLFGTCPYCGESLVLTLPAGM